MGFAGPFYPDEMPGTLYVLFWWASDPSVSQLGITARPEERLASHARHGWRVRRLFDFPTWTDAYRVEQAVISHLTTVRGLTHALEPEDMPQRGYTETFRIPADELAELVEALRVEPGAQLQLI